MQKKLNRGHARSVEKGYIEYEEKYKMDVTRETANSNWQIPSFSAFSRKYGGAGLGLAITKSIIDSHNGSIDVKSKIGKGTVFLIRLPAQIIR